MMKRGLFILFLLLLAGVMFILPQSRVQIAVISLLVIMTLFAHEMRDCRPWNTTLEILTLYFSLNLIFQVTQIDQLFILTHFITLIVFYLYLVVIKKYKPVKSYLKKGNLKGSLPLALLFGVIAVVFLVIWFVNQSGNPHAEYMPSLPLYWLLPLGIGFALVNGLYEEGIFRGLLFPAFTESVGYFPAIVLQAVWFSFLHYQAGFPSGLIGIGLTFVFAMMMAVLLKRTGGLLLPILVHALADFIIFIMIWLRINQLL